MTYDKQRSLQLLRLGSGKSDACFREGQEGAIMQPWASGWMQHKPDDLNYTNRPVRIRMPGGVGGARSGILTAPIPIPSLWCQSATRTRDGIMAFCLQTSDPSEKRPSSPISDHGAGAF